MTARGPWLAPRAGHGHRDDHCHQVERITFPHKAGRLGLGDGSQLGVIQPFVLLDEMTGRATFHSCRGSQPDEVGSAQVLVELAVFASGSLSRLSYVVKRLEQRGWVRRERCPGDGRATR